MESLKFALVPGQMAWARSPVRLDLSGGWTDTPPYTNLYGGAVVNVAVDLNGLPPVQVFVLRTKDLVLSLKSIDLNCEETVSTIASLQNYKNPNSPFGLAKAALCQVLGENLRHNKDLMEILSSLGGGLSVTTFVAVPKGSGLGTSSVLGAAILGALHKSFGIRIAINEFLQKVLELETMLTTGGGWQDQVGGALGGVKFTENSPGKHIRLDVEYLDSALFLNHKTSRQFVLYYTGQTRLAKGILSEVVEKVQTKDPEYLSLHQDIRTLATAMRSAISRRSLTEVGRNLAAYWQLKQRIHPSTTNTEIQELFSNTRHLALAGCLMGAGGGGYAMFLAKSPQDAEALRKFLAVTRMSESARLVDWSLNPSGLEVSLS